MGFLSSYEVSSRCVSCLQGIEGTCKVYEVSERYILCLQGVEGAIEDIRGVCTTVYEVSERHMRFPDVVLIKHLQFYKIWIYNIVCTIWLEGVFMEYF